MEEKSGIHNLEDVKVRPAGGGRREKCSREGRDADSLASPTGQRRLWFLVDGTRERMHVLSDVIKIIRTRLRF